MPESGPRWNPRTQRWEFGPPEEPAGPAEHKPNHPPAAPTPPPPAEGPAPGQGTVPDEGPTPGQGAPQADGSAPGDGSAPAEGSAPRGSSGGAGQVPAPAPTSGQAPGAWAGVGPAAGAGHGVGQAAGGGFGAVVAGGPAYDPLGGAAASVADAETQAAGAWPGTPGGHPGALPALPPHPPVPPQYGPTGGPFVPSPPPPPPPPRPAGQGWLTPLTAAVAVAALAAGAAAVWFVQRGDETPAPRPSPVLSSAPVSPTGDAGEASPTPSDQPSDQASPSPSPSSSPSAPAGYRLVDDPAGFRITVPEGWQREELKTGVFYRSADRTSLVQVFRVNEPGMTPLEAVRGASEQLSANPGFTQIEIGDRGDGSAELVYEYDSAETGSRRRGVERVLTTPDGRMYAVLVAAPASGWPVHREIQAAALKDFAPTP